MNSTNLSEIEKISIEGKKISQDQARLILDCPDSYLLELVGAASRVREKFFGKRVKLNYLVNVKSGICPEDCHYCSQSKLSEAPIEKYPLLSTDEIIDQAERGMAVGASRACLVASGRGPGEKEISDFCQSVEALKKKHPGLEVCACLGLLQAEQASKLKSAGVFAYNHNINTSQRHYEKICGTHTYEDRLDTIEKAQKGGLSSCSGVLTGMGESEEDLIEVAFTLREKAVESIPVNFLVPIKKTPLQNMNLLTPQKCLKILALFRLVNPTAEIRIAGGREFHLRTLQPLGLRIANSIFIGDYLTTRGQSARLDLEMIRDLGYHVQGKPLDFLDIILSEPQVTLKEKKDEPVFSKC